MVSCNKFWQDIEGALERATSFADNTTDVTVIEANLKEQQRLKSGMDMLQKEVVTQYLAEIITFNNFSINTKGC